ncbi:putative Alpha-1,6-galactosidase [Verrucomicrobia bacterium]|nr:putative Alpha-1,6-galactosidase [Verrucomicrobiota bacterium]
MGWFGQQFYLVVSGRPLVATSGAVVPQNGKGLLWQGHLTPQLKLCLRVQPSPTGHGWTVTPVLQNQGTTGVAFTGYGFRAGPDQPGLRYQHPAACGLALFAHTDNLRYENLPHSRVQFPFVRSLPTKPLHLGVQSQGPLPALILGQTESRFWLVEGALSQQRHLISWHLGLPSRSDAWADRRSEFTWMGGCEEVVPAGQEVELETTVFLLVQARPEQVYQGYMEELTARHTFIGPQSRLDREPVYCTWNYGVFTNVTEADCLKRMDVVAKVQGGGFFQLDHGYQPPTLPGGQATPEVDPYYPDGSRSWDLSRFPSGPKGFVKACRMRGLRPALWWSPRVDLDGPIKREHPEWLLMDRDGQPIKDVGHHMLDCSVPEARAFMEMCIQLITREWGFEGIKLDFFSWMFDHAEAKYRHGGTGTEWKRWMISMMRSQLGPRGYFLHGVSCPLGNPFLAVDGFDAYRAGIDIDRGAWDYHVRNCSWLLPGILANSRRTWFGNIDSCLGAPGFPAVERRSRLAFAYMTSGMLEFSGPVEQFDAALLSEYRRLVERCDQGGSCRCPDTQAFFGRPLPCVLVRYHARGSYTRKRFGAIATIAFFNWGDATQSTALSLAEVGLAQQRIVLHDFWTGKARAHSHGIVVAALPPRAHLLLDVLPK